MQVSKFKRSPGRTALLLALLFISLLLQGRPLKILADQYNDKTVRRRNRRKITITVNPNLVEKIDKLVEDRIFVNRSHAIESLIKKEVEELK